MTALPPSTRLRIVAHGAVQGIGFRPFVHHLASELGLTGWVNNSGQGVVIELEGPKGELDDFLQRLDSDKPPASFIQSMETSWLEASGYSRFEIQDSSVLGRISAIVMPDMATCPHCLLELFDPQNRRYHYPFINCTHCGPRYTIIESLPYDRARTTMRAFVMCPECAREYGDFSDRRFHAEPNACPVCGPQLELWDPCGQVLARREDALVSAAAAVRGGKILALKGIGGFQFIVDARNDSAVRRLRDRKSREEKPFAVMYPSLSSASVDCHIGEAEMRLLVSVESPIVLLRRKTREEIPSVAPGNPNLGVMLPYSPLHHLLLRELGFPVVATSGNLSDEPICTDERDALHSLGNIADVFLVHNRPIARHMDDSIARILLGREQILRRARGYAPLPIMLSETAGANDSILSVGAHLKNSVALAIDGQVFLSQHIGDLSTVQAYGAFYAAVFDLQRLYQTEPSQIVCDNHPDYLSTKFADEYASERPAVRQVAVQHHIAHVLACAAENEVVLPALGVSWDGTGLGLDGTIWGGEFFLVTRKEVERVGHFRSFQLPGGDSAAQEPRRAAIGLLYELYGDELFKLDSLEPVRAFAPSWRPRLAQMLKTGLNSPRTTSAGRLFDAVASLCGVRQNVSFEGQAAMELEFAAEQCETSAHYELKFQNGPIAVFDWEPLIGSILLDLGRKLPVEIISAKFHNTLAEVIVGMARRVGRRRIVLSGGCFQNRYLTEHAVHRLTEEGFSAFWHQRVPTNDGGIALGQIVGALRLEGGN